MRVPADPDNPTFDDTFDVSFGRWFRSTAAERKEWTRRRNAAAKLARDNQQQRIDAWAAEKQAAIAERQAAAADQYATARDNLQASTAELAALHDPVVARCESVKLRQHTIQYGRDQQPLAGVTATIETGETLTRRTTATRVIGGALLAGPAGAIIGAIARKKTGGTQYLVIAGPAFEWQIQVDRGDVDRARKFAAKVNTAAKQDQE